MNEELEGLLPFYALGALGAEERARVEAYLESDPEALARFKEYQATVRALAYAAAPVSPAAASKRSVRQRIRAGSGLAGPSSEARPDRRKRIGPGLIGRLAPALSLVIAAISLGAVLATRAELLRLETQNSELARQLADYQGAISLLGAPDLLAVAVEGTDAAAHARGSFLARSEARSGVLLVSGLPPLEPGMAYQAWLIRESTPYPAGLLVMTAEGTGTLSLEAPEAVGLFDTVAVSLEPQAGSLQPTGPILLLGNLSG